MINSRSEAGETYFGQCSQQKRRKQSDRINKNAGARAGPTFGVLNEKINSLPIGTLLRGLASWLEVEFRGQLDQTGVPAQWTSCSLRER